MSKGTPDTSDVTHAVTSGNAVETVSAAEEETTAEHKFTAKQVEEECPLRLQQIGKEIGERLKRAEKQTRLAADHVIAVDKLLAEAKGLCDGGGFNKFRKLFCPQLGKSQAYALLAIGSGKKTLAEHRTAERQRKQKSRANRRAAPANSGTVPENSSSEPEASTAPADAEPEIPNIERKQQTLETTKHRSSDRSNETGLSRFTTYVMELRHKISKHKVEHFLPTTVSADDLAKVGKFLTDLAIAKKSEAIRSAAIVAVPEDGSDRPAVRADGAVLETSTDLVA
jgi:hypothetical protein